MNSHYFVKFNGFFGKDGSNYVIFDDRYFAYWSFMFIPNAVIFGIVKVDDTFTSYFNILEEKDYVKQTEDDSKES